MEIHRFFSDPSANVTSRIIMPNMNSLFRLGIAPRALIGVWLVVLPVLMNGCAARKSSPVAASSRFPTAMTTGWNHAAIPFKVAGITAVGDVVWACGENEMIASSSDGGWSWNLRHQNSGGATLLDIRFLTEKVGHAAGTKGRLLSTEDGGRTWKAHSAAGDVWAF